MKRNLQIKAFLNILKSKFLNKNIPIAVRWKLTFRCNLNCKYCNLPYKKVDELDTDEVFSILKQLKKAGTVHVSFSGGEPLLRDDIGEIIDYSYKIGISSSLNTNGTFVKDKIDELKKLDLLKISLDGPEEIHNEQRGNFSDVIEAVNFAQKNGIKTMFLTTVTEKNFDKLCEVVRIGEKYSTIVAFQKISCLGLYCLDNIRWKENNQKKFKKEINKLIDLKNEDPRYIRGSVKYLKLLKDFPERYYKNCKAGKIFYLILPDGTIAPCDRTKFGTELSNLRNKSLQDCLKDMPKPNCSGCIFPGSMEMNYLYDFDLLTYFDIRRFL